MPSENIKSDFQWTVEEVTAGPRIEFVNGKRLKTYKVKWGYFIFILIKINILVKLMNLKIIFQLV